MYSDQLKSQAGLGLLEALIAVVVLGIVGLSFAAIAEFTSRGLQQAKGLTEASELASKIYHALSNRSACEYNLLANQVSPSVKLQAKATAPIVRASLKKLNYYDSAGAITGTLINLDDPASKFKPANITIVPKVDLAASNQIMAHLIVSYDAPHMPASSRTIPILLKMSGSDITSCSTSIDTDLEIKSMSCGLGSNGAQKYDATTDSCIDALEHKTVRSDNPFSVTCPVGFRPDTSGGGCGNIEDIQIIAPSGLEVTFWGYKPSDFNNCPVSLITRNYSDGSTLIFCDGYTLCSPSGADSCNCQWANGVNPAGHTIQLDCVK